MPSLDDEQFEKYLRRFHPIAPKPRLTAKTRRRSRHLSEIAAWIAAAAVILIAGTALWHTHTTRVGDSSIRDVASVEPRAPLEPLTIATANSWLTTAPSFKAAVDGLAFRGKRKAIPPEGQSAIAVLGKEDAQL